MSKIRIIAAILVLGAIAGIVKQRSAIAALRERNEVLRDARQEILRLRTDNAALPAVRAAISTQPLADSANSELLRLRNEASRLRAERAEMNRVKAENTRLESDIRAGAARPQEISEMTGYLPAESWANAGFATPESALQTFFWAARSGNLARLADCFPGDEGRHIRQLADSGMEQDRERMLNDVRQIVPIEGYCVVDNVTKEEGYQTRGGGPPTGTEPRIATKVMLRVQAVTGGALWSVSLRLEPDGWKLKPF